MQTITNRELKNLSNRVLSFYKTKIGIDNDTYCVDIEALAELLGFKIHN